MNKVTLLYGHPTDVEAFEKHYNEFHLPLASQMEGVSRLELTKFSTSVDGGKPEWYRMAELYFLTRDQMVETMGSPEGQAVIDDLQTVCTGGMTIMIGDVENVS